MKAVVLEKGYARAVDFEASLLKVQNDFPLPEDKEGYITVRVHAAGLNPVDYKVGAFGNAALLPRVVGFDVAGVVHKVGKGVSGFKEGDRVYYHGSLYDKWGGFAEYSRIPAIAASKIPDNVTFEEAAALPTAGWTAYKALHDKARVKAGETILITAGAGGVGGFAIQLCRLAGLTIITTTSAKNTEHVKKLGADHVIDYTKEDITARVKEITNGRGVDYWLDVIGSDSADVGLKNLAFNGSLIVVQGNPTTPLGELFTRQISVHDIFLGGAHNSGDERSIKNLGDIGNEMVKLVSEKKLDPLIKKVITLEEVPQGLADLKGGHVQGKIIAKLL